MFCSSIVKKELFARGESEKKFTSVSGKLLSFLFRIQKKKSLGVITSVTYFSQDYSNKDKIERKKVRFQFNDGLAGHKIRYLRRKGEGGRRARVKWKIFLDSRNFYHPGIFVVIFASTSHASAFFFYFYYIYFGRGKTVLRVIYFLSSRCPCLFFFALLRRDPIFFSFLMFQLMYV